MEKKWPACPNCVWMMRRWKIVGFIEQLGEVDTDNVEPLSNVARKTLQLRADVVNDGNCQDKVLANAPDSVEGYFAVSKVVE
jgi:aspartyl-tRNA(Asn)/glutamyl-tRNA(Gln) amidotransferase subunit C